MSSQTIYPHITMNSRGVPCVDGTRHRVMDLAEDHVTRGYSAEQIVEHYPDLTLAQVYAALAYYYDHQAEIDAALMASYERAEQLRKRHTPHPKLLAARTRQEV